MPLPELPPIPEYVLDRRHSAMSYWREAGERRREWTGPVGTGMIFAWEPDLPKSRKLIIVIMVTTRKEIRDTVWFRDLDSGRRGSKFYPGPAAVELGDCYCSMGRFREAVLPTLMKDQTP